jgi:hypothetical protein
MWRVVSHSLLFVILLSTRRVIPKTLMTPEVCLPAFLPFTATPACNAYYYLLFAC